MKRIMKGSIIFVSLLVIGLIISQGVIQVKAAKAEVTGELGDLTPAETKERFQNAYDEALLKGNLDAIDEIVAPEYVVHHRYWTNSNATLDGLKEFLKNIRLAFSECRVILDEVLISGDRVIMRSTFQGTYASDSNGKWTFQNEKTGESETINVPIPAGTKYTEKRCDILRIENGLIVEQWAYTNTIVPALRAAGIKLDRK